MRGRCKNYGAELDCCQILSNFNNPMEELYPCAEGNCKYYQPQTNLDMIRSIGAEEVSHELTKLFYKVAQYSNAEHYIKEWLQQEAEE